MDKSVLNNSIMSAWEEVAMFETVAEFSGGYLPIHAVNQIVEIRTLKNKFTLLSHKHSSRFAGKNNVCDLC